MTGPGATTPRPTIEVMTLNLWGRNGPVDRRMDGLADYLAGDRPDLVALQEVAGFRGVSQAAWLADRLGYATAAEISTGRGPWPGEGLAVVTDLAATPLEPVALPHGWDAHPRAVQQLEVDLPGGTRVRIANTHLAYRLQAGELRSRQTTEIREELISWSGPVVLLGDLNDVLDAPPLAVLTTAAPGFDPLLDALTAAGRPERWTFDPANPYASHEELLRRRVDHILVRGLSPVDARVVLTGDDAPPVSDHYGVRARLHGQPPDGRER